MILEPMSTKYTAYLTDESHIKGECEDILFPENEEELSECIKLSLKDNKKLTVQGARTGLNGACVPESGRILNLSKLNSIGEIEKTENGAQIKVGCGAALEGISKIANSKGFIFPVNATEETASAGGMFSTNAAGPNSVFYSSFSSYVKSVNFVFPTGESATINRGDYIVKDKKLKLPNGKTLDFSNIPDNLPIDFYKEDMDLIDFLSGKEGVFGVAESFVLELIKKPNDLWGIVFFFEDEEKALGFSQKIYSYEPDSAKLTTAEYFNEDAINLIKLNLNNPLLAKLPELPETAKTAIYVEIESDSEDESEMALMDLLDIFAQTGGNEEDTWAQNGETAVKSFRDMRHAVVSLLNEDMNIIVPTIGTRIETDVKGETEKFKEYIDFYNSILSKYSLKAVIYGSIIKNHLHAAILDNSENAIKAQTEIYQKAVEDGAIIGAKYGIGRAKRNIISECLTEVTKSEIKKIRSLIDPESLMNP